MRTSLAAVIAAAVLSAAILGEARGQEEEARGLKQQAAWLLPLGGPDAVYDYAFDERECLVVNRGDGDSDYDGVLTFGVLDDENQLKFTGQMVVETTGPAPSLTDRNFDFQRLE